ncbi:MAG TPA: peptidase dimerization domain-containing protein [Gaiellaceae bacterium]|nr:peptidase dimerization domain-containing protein [Gaiellaceae bacterium]
MSARGAKPQALPEALAGLEPEAFWERFAELTTIARPSRAEEPVIAHVRAWAEERGFDFREDAGRNVVVRVPATSGREEAPVVTLQGHLDMVCERDPESPNDPARGRIALVRDGEWLKADGTTLGADDGVAIAAMMALAEDASVPHGPLELLMTVAEEVGLEGANALDPALVTGSILVNLDSEEDGRLTVGCAGSTDTWLRIDAPRRDTDADAVTLTVTVGGGLGGHSGSGIALGLSNAVKVLGRVLREAHAATPFRLASLSGGKSRNAIPRAASAVCSVPAARETDFRAALTAAAGTVRDQYSKTDPGVTVSVEPAEPPERPWMEEATQIAAAEVDKTGTTTLGKRVVDHSFQLPLQVAWIVTALVGIVIVYIFFGSHTPAPPATTAVP